MKKTAIIIFIKNPDLGRVKKRLAQSIGDDHALGIYKGMLEHTQTITRALNTDKYLFYDRAKDMNDNWPNDIYHKEVQSGQYMVNRIQNALKKIFARGYEHVVIIGSDCLELDERVIRLAFRQLEHFDTVLGPTKDGGFYLLGMNNYDPEILKVPAWGTSSLVAGVTKAIHHLHKTYFTLSELTGIVTADDLNDNLKQLIT
ncbi:TIGR04282 family arsenosugar biosynthesis glycosyltransferase [Mucilaginibacter sp. AW1-3]